MTIAIMQPYVFPYIGYFQMMKASDVFVLYDDVNYIKQGWVNRNRILVSGKDALMSIPLKGASSFKQINEIEVNYTLKDYRKILPTIDQNYKKAPYFNTVFPLIDDVFKSEKLTIADFAEQSIQSINNYLGIETEILRSSVSFSETKELDRADRLIEICKRLKATDYINALGGQELYTKPFFKSHNINLHFIKSLPVEYQQFQNEFVSWLSIIDVLMFNSVEETHTLLNKFELI